MTLNKTIDNTYHCVNLSTLHPPHNILHYSYLIQHTPEKCYITLISYNTRQRTYYITLISYNTRQRTYYITLISYNACQRTYYITLISYNTRQRTYYITLISYNTHRLYRSLLGNGGNVVLCHCVKLHRVTVDAIFFL